MEQGDLFTLSLPKTVYDNRYIKHIFSVLIRSISINFGLAEAVLFGGAVDFYHRYFMVQSFFPLLDEGIILDVGCGKIGVGAFLQHRPDIICMDIDPHSVKSATGHKIVASAGNIPLRPVIAVGVSVDCYEHLPKPIRSKFIKDLTDICSAVVLHFPSGEHAIQCDRRFDITHKKLFGKPQAMHSEHLKHGLPSEDEPILPRRGVQIRVPTQNANVNYILFVLQSLPIIGWMTGILFKVFLQRNYDKPPYYSQVVVWVK